MSRSATTSSSTGEWSSPPSRCARSLSLPGCRGISAAGSGEPQVFFWVPCVEVKRHGSRKVAEKLVWFMPYIWVDNAMSLATGRETYGYPKTFGRLGFPQANQPRKWTLEAFGLNYGPGNKAQYHPIMEVTQTGGFTDTIDQSIDNVLDLAREFADQIFGTRDPGEVRAGIDFHVENIKNAFEGHMYQVFLKQIRSAEPGLGAALQQVVQGRYDITEVHGFPHPHPSEFKFTVREIDSHPVIADLGLRDQEVAAAMHSRFEFEVTNGTVLWDSGAGSLAPPSNGHGGIAGLFERIFGRAAGNPTRSEAYFERARVRAALRAAAVAPSRAVTRGRAGGRCGRPLRRPFCDSRASLEHLLDAVHEDEVEVLAQVLRNVLDVLLVQLRRDHALDAGGLGGERLLLQPADRQHLPDQGQLAGHGGVLAHRPAGDQRGERGGHRDAGRRPVLRDRTGGHVDVEVVRLEEVLGQIGLQLADVRAHE